MFYIMFDKISSQPLKIQNKLVFVSSPFKCFEETYIFS
jgi:hypothetical protein